MYQRFGTLGRYHNYPRNYWNGTSSRWSSSQVQADDPPQPDHPMEPPLPKIRSILDNLMNTRRNGLKLEDAQEQQLYKLYRNFLRGKNCSQIEHSICHLFETIEDHDLKSMRKLTKRLASKEWFGLAYQVQHVVAASTEGTKAIKSFKRLSDLALKNRDFTKAERALEEAQGRIVEMLLEQAVEAEKTDVNKALQIYEDAYGLCSNISKVEVAFKFTTLLSRSNPSAAVEKLEHALDCIKLVTKEIIANKGMVPKYLASRVEELPAWKERIEQRLAELQEQQVKN